MQKLQLVNDLGMTKIISKHKNYYCFGSRIFEKISFTANCIAEPD